MSIPRLIRDIIVSFFMYALTVFLIVGLPILVDHTTMPTPIPGAVEESVRSEVFSSSRPSSINRPDKPFGSHPDAAEPQHPFAAPAGNAGIHADAAASDVHKRGPTGQKKGGVKVVTRVGSKFPGGMCATMTFNREGKIVVLCASLRRFEIHMMEPKTLELLAVHPLPTRPSTWAFLMTLQTRRLMQDTSSAYLYLDNEDRVVIGDANQHLRRIGHRKTADGSGYEFYDVDDWNLGFMIPFDCMSWNNWFPSSDPEACDPITAVIPDFEGNIWFVTRRGIVGALDPKRGKVVASLHLHEEMQNGLTAGVDGVWIVTDFGLYLMKVVATPEKRHGSFQPRGDADGVDGGHEIHTVWRAGYDRGTFQKVGMLSVGSGTTPTLFDGRFVTITDNNDEQIKLLVYDLEKVKRESAKKENARKTFAESDAPLVCKAGLFAPAASAGDNSMIAVDGSIFFESNKGYHNAINQQRWGKKEIPGGVVRVDLIFEKEDEGKKKNENGEKNTPPPPPRAVTGCKTVWQSAERAPSCVAKMGQENGLLYYYTLETDEVHEQQDKEITEAAGGASTVIAWLLGSASQRKEPMWALTAVDAHTGKTVFKVPTGRGRNFDNNWGPVTLGKDGTAYVGCIRGLIAIYDE